MFIIMARVGYMYMQLILPFGVHTLVYNYGGHCQDLERVNDILLSLSRGSEVAVIVQYSTSPSCSAVQWLEPAQTAGKQHPYLFTQCQVRAPRSCNKVGNGAEGKDS
jgi:hypothetical protein